jgi:hypothetical protein
VERAAYPGAVETTRDERMLARLAPSGATVWDSTSSVGVDSVTVVELHPAGVSGVVASAGGGGASATVRQRVDEVCSSDTELIGWEADPRGEWDGSKSEE